MGLSKLYCKFYNLVAKKIFKLRSEFLKLFEIMYFWTWFAYKKPFENQTYSKSFRRVFNNCLQEGGFEGVSIALLQYKVGLNPNIL